MIWLGRRAAYLGQYRAAHEIFSRGLETFPGSARLLRHRGHRRLSLRDWRAAVEDLGHAARLVAWQPDEIEADGAPNAAGIPRSTLQSNIWYHLGLAHFLLGEFEAAESAYWPGLEVSRVNDDMLCATSYWLYLSLMRQGKTYSATALLEAIHAEMDVIENFSYHNLLLMYKGELGIESVRQELETDSIQNATLAFGIASAYLHEGNREAALRTLRGIVEKENWASFAYMAAEAELDRLGALR